MAHPADQELEALRREVDRVDRAIVELLADRLRIVRAIAAAKAATAAAGPAIRPGREAVILRRLVAQAGAGFPAATLVRMWRELLAATTRAQAPLTVVACVPADDPGLWDLARDHFGSTVPLPRTADPHEAVRRVAGGEADLAVLPAPSASADWWAGIAEGEQAAVRILARLPFGPAGPQLAGCSALVVGRGDPEPSGDDVALYRLDTPPDCDLGSLLAAMPAAPRLVARLAAPGSATVRYLVEVDGFPPAAADRLEQLAQVAHAPILRSLWLGGYARPLAAGE